MKKKIICIMLGLITLSQIGTITAKAETRADELVWKLHTQTSLGETNEDWSFQLGDYNRDGIQDLYSFNKVKREIHILNGADNFQTFLLDTTTNFGSNEKWDFTLGDYNKDGYLDIYGIAKSNTGSGKTEVHILDGKSNYQKGITDISTAHHETDGNWTFQVGDYNRDGIQDLYAFNKDVREIHILNGADNFQTYLTNLTTNLGSREAWEFGLGDYNQDGHLDVYAIAKANTGSGVTELHVLDGSKNFQSSLLQTPTIEETKGDNYQFLVGPGKVNIYGIMKNSTGSKTTEVHQFVSTSESTPPPAISIGDKIIDEAEKHLGKPYVWGAKGPSSFDCSGFTSYVFRNSLGREIGGVTTSQVNIGTPVTKSNLKKGDLVFFDNTYDGQNPTHVGIYVGNGTFIHCADNGVAYSNLNSGYWLEHYARARRVE
ncbi:NlpC/P60 family protein [Clostridium gasigenes]|uniref:NlpC/P60 family protein n=1 Tax=Clostridium gasigenes TaxID=94869 RepID=UPI001C0AE3C6|nr:NlpC/P60 family protein [Clostridium gasigenes]MBU3103008.1 C40 family peptidase [Clostridium gasigenes]